MILNTLKRHFEVAREAWRLDVEKGVRPVSADVDFLPEALAVMERPANPAGRAAVWAIISFLCLALVWALIGKVDIVATALGRIEPRGQVKMIQTTQLGTVRAIHVINGQHVKAGDPLVDLDATLSDADLQQAELDFQVATMAYNRASQLLTHVDGLAGQEGGRSVALVGEMLQGRLVEAQIATFQATMQTVQERRAALRAQLAAQHGQYAKLKETLPLLEEQVAAREELVGKGLSPRLLYLEQKERLIAHQKDLEIQAEQLQQSEANLDGARQELVRLTEDFRGSALKELTDARDRQAMARANVEKAKKQLAEQALTAPVDGTVQQLTLHTIGGVVKPGDAVMVIVPGDDELVAEAMLLNRDIGFVKVGDPVEIKLETYPFTRYGVLHGKLESVSSDAIQHEQLGLVFTIRVRLDQQMIEIAGQNQPLSAGMALTAEIKTGSRRLIDFLLDPVSRHRNEALRER